MREQWLAQAGGIDAVRKMADYAGVSIDRLLSTKKTKTFEAEVKRLEAAFAAVQKRVQGLLDELGKVSQTGGLLSGDLATRLLGDFDKPEIQDAFKAFVTTNLDAATKGLTDFLNASKSLPLTTKSAEALGAALGGIFERMRQLGTPLADALRALQPALTALEARLKQAGLSGGAAFDALRAMATLASDEIAGPLLSASIVSRKRWSGSRMRACSPRRCSRASPNRWVRRGPAHCAGQVGERRAALDGAFAPAPLGTPAEVGLGRR